MRRQYWLGIMVAVVGALLAPPMAEAHNPNNCLSNGVDLTLAETSALVRQGDTLTFLVGIQNTNVLLGTPCNITAANIGVRLPNADGRYDPASPAIAVVTNQGFPSGFPFQQVGRFDWVVKLNPRVEFGSAQATVGGTLHITDPDRDFAGIVKDVSFTVTNPSISIDKTGSTTGGVAPQTVVYTYEVTNTSQTPVPMNQVTVDDNLCAGPKYDHGDNGDNLLSNGEKWYFTCTSLFQNAGTFVNTAKACAISTVDKRPVCSPPDTWTVVVTPPPGPPPAAAQPVAVKPTTAAQAPCTLSRATKTTVRAGQLNTIRVKVSSVDAGTTVKITLPGGKVVSAKTSKTGIAEFKVKPAKSGTASIRAAACSDVERLSVKPARRVVAQKVPRVTG